MPGSPDRTAPQARGALPGFAYVLILLGGPWAALPYLRRIPSRGFRAALVAAALAPFPAAALLPYNWLLLGMAFAGWNLLWGFAALAACPPERAEAPAVPASRRLKLSLGLALAGAPLAALLASLEQWLTDALWSSYYPVNASLDSISTELAAVWLGFGLLLFFSALQAARERSAWTPSALAGLALLVAGAHLVANQAHLLLVTIPLWQVQELAIFPPWLDRMRHVLFFALWFAAVPPLVHAAFRAARSRRSFLGGYLRGLASLALAMAGLAATTGLPINYAMLAGQHHEKSGTPARAIPWYSKALAWSRSDPLKSYLQFRVALLHRKGGNLEEAKEAFIRVLVKYHHDSRLLLKAQEFRDRLEKRGAEVGGGEAAQAGQRRSGLSADSALPRVVIPGMEARTEYKSAYCVPNSLGLLLNFWGDRTGAKRIGAEITQLERGSLITDQVFFAESRGFASLVLPLRTLDDIFRLIDRGIPVLAFIPGHVIAVFGYDRALQTLVTYDVNTYDIWDDQSWSEFGQDWSRLYNTLGVVVPKSRLPELREVLGEGIEAADEAYLQYLIAKLKEDGDDAARHLGRAAGKGIFFADWDFRHLLGRGGDPGDPGSIRGADADSAGSAFLLGHEVYESQILDYLRSLYQRGDWRRAIAFIERYRQENRLSSGIATLLAGCYHRIGDSPKAGEVLLSYLDLDDQEPVTLEFLLGRDYVRDDPETARRISLKLLASEDRVAGSAAALAFRTWRNNTVVDFRNIDEALALMEDYLDRWNPYDRAAIRELAQAIGRKQFRPDDEFNRQSWMRKIRLLESRLEPAP